MYQIDIRDDAKCVHNVTMGHICVSVSWTLLTWS